ncbi:hypothetical protein HUU05_00580 [candidate division KSB1 bacterium]|nr:hypothetical protein [candidate division KSB1 bacterium]
MPSVNLNLSDSQLNKATEIAARFSLQPEAYLLLAIDYFNRKKERELLAEQFKTASEKTRSESLLVCEEFDEIDEIPD